MTVEQITNNWKKAKTDKERWDVVLNNASQIHMILDNDLTSVSFGDEEAWYDFDGYIGWNNCALELMRALGLKSCELC